jgi:hypothetical protein
MAGAGPRPGLEINGYNIQHIPSARRPGSAAQEHRYWYQRYFHKIPKGEQKDRAQYFISFLDPST